MPLSRKAIFNQGLCALAVGLGALVMTATIGYTSPALASMQEDPNINVTDNQASWIGAVVPGMALIGSLLAAPLIENYGRKFILTATCIPYMLSWALIGYSSTANGVIVARTLCGLCMGIERVAMSVFMSESVHVSIRSTLMAIPQFLATAGFLVINASGKYLDWRGLGWFGVSLVAPMLLLLLYLPETPYYCLKQGQKTKALNTLKWLRESTPAANAELADLTKGLTSKDANSLTISSILTPPYRNGFIIAVLLHIFQQLTGITAFLTFLTVIFEKSGSSIDPRTFSVIMTSSNFITVFLSAYLFQKHPRKKFINISSQVMIASLLVLASYVWARDSDTPFRYISEQLGYIPLIALSAYTLGFSLGWGPLPWMFIGEGLHSKSRGLGSSLAVAINWTFAFVTTKLFSVGFEVFGLYGVFIICACLTFLGMILINKYMPETFRKTPIQMDNYYEGIDMKKKK